VRLHVHDTFNGDNTQLVGAINALIKLDDGEQLVAVRPEGFYELGQPMQGDVIAGHILAEATSVIWDSISQKWIS